MTRRPVNRTTVAAIRITIALATLANATAIILAILGYLTGTELAKAIIVTLIATTAGIIAGVLITHDPDKEQRP